MAEDTAKQIGLVAALIAVIWFLAKRTNVGTQSAFDLSDLISFGGTTYGMVVFGILALFAIVVVFLPKK